MTDYLRGYAAASVPGIRLVCKHVLANGPATTSEIRDALRPTDLMPGAEGEGATLPASLEVAKDIELLTNDGGKRDPVWSPGSRLETLDFAQDVLQTAYAFRPVILQSVSKTALKLTSDEQRPSDVSVAMTWVLSRDPLRPLRWDYGGLESTLKAEGMSDVIDTAEQWRSFRRWFTALGLGTALRAPRNRTMLSVSTASAICGAGIQTQGPMPARDFISSLLGTVPILGHPSLLSQLPPVAKRGWGGVVSPAVAQGLLELEAMNSLRMLPGDDSEAVVGLVVGGESRAVRSIEWLGEGR
jgi:hypothetical protein